MPRGSAEQSLGLISVYFLARQEASCLGHCVMLLRGFFFNFHAEFLVVLDGRFRLAQAGASWLEVEFLRHDIFFTFLTMSWSMVPQPSTLTFEDLVLCTCADMLSNADLICLVGE